MKIPINLLLVLACLALATSAQSQIVVSDEFTNAVVDTSKWIPVTPFAGSQITQAGGKVSLIRRGILQTVTNLPTRFQVQGRFKFAGSLDHFRMVFRSDLAVLNSFNELSGAIFILGQDGECILSGSEVGSEIKVTNVSLSAGQDIDFRVTDDGSVINIFVKDLIRPTLTLTNSTSRGRRLAFYNREISGTRVEVDRIEIRSLDPVLTIYPAIEIEFPSDLGRQYQIETTTNFLQWTNLDGPIAGDGNPFRKLYSTRGTGRLFYRVNILP